MKLWIPYAGSLGVGRSAIGAGPLISFMGRKDRLAPRILAAMGNPKPDALVVNDCGLWGDVWRHLLSDGAEVVATLKNWKHVDRCHLWDVLATMPPLGGPQGVAQFLYLQGRSIRGIPLYWRDGRWVCHRADGTLKAAAQRQPPIPGKGGGGITAAGIAKRVKALIEHPWPACETYTVDASDPVMWSGLRAGDWVYADSPYSGCTPYQIKHGRNDVLDLARMCASRGARVAISEAVPLEELSGWRSIDLTAHGHGKAEWLTVSP